MVGLEPHAAASVAQPARNGTRSGDITVRASSRLTLWSRWSRCSNQHATWSLKIWNEKKTVDFDV